MRSTIPFANKSASAPEIPLIRLIRRSKKSSTVCASAPEIPLIRLILRSKKSSTVCASAQEIPLIPLIRRPKRSSTVCASAPKNPFNPFNPPTEIIRRLFNSLNSPTEIIRRLFFIKKIDFSLSVQKKVVLLRHEINQLASYDLIWIKRNRMIKLSNHRDLTLGHGALAVSLGVFFASRPQARDEAFDRDITLP